MFLFLLACSTLQKTAVVAPLQVHAFSQQEAKLNILGRTSGSSSKKKCFGITISPKETKFIDSSEPRGGLFGIGSFNNPERGAALYKALKSKNADILLSPIYTVENEIGLFCSVQTVIVSGFAATVVGFAGSDSNIEPNSDISEVSISSESTVEAKAIQSKPVLTSEPKEISVEVKKTEPPTKNEAQIQSQPNRQENITTSSYDLNLEVVQYKGSLGQNTILETIKSNSGIKKCFQESKGTLQFILSFIIGPKGTITVSNVLQSNGSEQTAEACVLKSLGYLKFPKAESITNVQLKFQKQQK